MSEDNNKLFEKNDNEVELTSNSDDVRDPIEQAQQNVELENGVNAVSTPELESTEHPIDQGRSPERVSPGNGHTTSRGERSVLYLHLSDGFRAVRKRRDMGPSDAIIRLDRTQEFLSYAMVNFVDPTSAPLSPGRSTSTRKPKRLFSRLASILEKDYNSTLRNVPYQHFRSGANGSIDTLPIKPYMTSSHGLADSDVPWAGAGPSGNDCEPSKWHCSPFCHVYLAPCDSLEDYRLKVKPSIQAFLSQIEASFKNNGARDATGSITSMGPQYVIVFVPCGTNASVTADDTNNAGGISRMGAFASRVVGNRQRVARDMAREISTDSGTSNVLNATPGSMVETTLDLDLEGSDGGGVTNQFTLGNLSRTDKEILRRFATDFPRGRVCALSSLFVNDDDNYDEDRDIQRTEWTVFLSNVGSAIGSGFRERCGRYDGELRRLDALRGSSMAGTTTEEFDLVYFFLVKESLAFSYEQMCLPSEALIQYDELNAVLPEINDATVFENETDTLKSLSAFAVSGDSFCFRNGVREIKDLSSVAHLFQTYLFSRVTSLLFKMNRSVEVMERCYLYICSMYGHKRDCVVDDVKAHMQLEKWAFDFCWDVKKACDVYLADDISVSNTYYSNSHALDSEPRRNRRIDEALARCVCDMVEFARLRLMKLGDLAFKNNPARLWKRSSLDMLRHAWTPWKAPQRGSSLRLLSSLGASEHSMMSSSQHSGLGSIDEGDELSLGCSVVSSGSEHFVEDAIKSGPFFLSLYLDVVQILVSFYQFSGRKRCAARLCFEMIDIYGERREYDKAIKVLRAMTDIFLQDRWHSNHFHVLFRLAYYQRRNSSAIEYLQTLGQCFSPLHAKFAPSKALFCLMRDLQAVLQSSGAPRHRFDAMPMFDPVLTLDGSPHNIQTGSDRGDLLKAVYPAGEKASMTFSLKSYLPCKIEIECVTIDLVPFREYMTAIEDSTVVRDENLFRFLTFGGPLTIHPGLNHFLLCWVPTVVGQYIMSSITIHWEKVRFYYLAKSLRRPTIRVDVLPAEPTQHITCTPQYLYPMQEQPLKIIFKPGTDIVKDVRLKLVCSPGVLVLCNDTATWCSSTAVNYLCCPSDGFETIIKVKCLTTEGTHAMHATVSTSYRPYCPKHDDCNVSVSAYGVKEDPFMNNNLTFTVSTLDRHALTVEKQEVVPYSDEKAIINLTIQCNTPSTLVLKSWNLAFPPSFTLLEGGDLNTHLANSKILSGEQIELSFHCTYDARVVSGTTECLLLAELLDVYGQIFNEHLIFRPKLPANLNVHISHLPSVPFSVTPAVLQGLVGKPLTILYEINTSTIGSMDQEVFYEINANSSDWLFSGKRQGVVRVNEDYTFIVTLIALPVRPGLLKQYPSLTICFSRGNRALSMSVPTYQLNNPEPFNALASDVHTTIAVPMPPMKTI